ncbi:HAMP domain-containing histidine kinase [Eggerthellaceae bacterium zg-997]|nr:HAMP domain-containing histidine kinase [Eggerthellaceae bacterium zg-997]
MAAVHRKVSFPAFLTRQLFGFMLLAMLIMVANLVMLGVLMGRADGVVSPEGTTFTSRQATETVRHVAEELTEREDGSFATSDTARENLERMRGWAVLVSAEGTVKWVGGVAPAVEEGASLSAADIAVIGRTGYYQGRPTFVWTRDDGVVLMSLPENSFVRLGATLPGDFLARLPLYVGVVILVNAMVVFLYVFVTQALAQRHIEPLSRALVDLSAGRPVDVSAGGALGLVADTLNEVSDIMRTKDRAREEWIHGVSHDIRTPLSLITGYADGLAGDSGLPEKARSDAAFVRAQALRIKDLVFDLNAAARLEYDSQPLDSERIALPAMLRAVVTEYLNDLTPERYELSLEVGPEAATVCVTGDERLLKRAIQNAIQNAMNHNPQGCSIALRLNKGLDQASGMHRAFVRVTDDGVGVSGDDLDRLQRKVENAAAGRPIQVSNCPAPPPRVVGAPTPPIDYLVMRQQQAEGFAKLADSEHGLGLQLVGRIAAAHGGSARVYSPAAGGFALMLCLPLD